MQQIYLQLSLIIFSLIFDLTQKGQMQGEEMDRKKESYRQYEVNNEGIVGQKKFKLDYVERENRPIVMQGDTLYIFIEGCHKSVMKIIRDICDPISKPQKVHEYKVTPASLLRAQALGYTKASILEFLNSNVRNKEGVTDRAKTMIEKEMGKQQSEIFLVYDQRECYYRLVIAPQNANFLKGILQQCIMSDPKIPPVTQNRNGKEYNIYRIHRYRHNQACQKLFNNSYPLKAARQLASFKSDDQSQYKGNRLPSYCHDITINLKSFTQLREYQAQALNAVIKVKNDKIQAKNGYIVLPCGAGKTLLGISILTKIKKQTMVVCSSDSGAEQWKREIQKWTQGLPRDNIIILTSSSDYVFRNSRYGNIYVSTYTSLKSKFPKQVKNKNQKIQNRWLMTKPWGLVIFDECQTLPAEQNRQIVNYLSAQVKIGLTATPMRQDDQIKTLNYMIGPQLYMGDWKTFVDQGYLANPKCIQIRTKLSERFLQLEKEYSTQVKFNKDLMYKINSNKIKALIYLLQIHKNDNVLVFSDDITVLEHMAKCLNKPILMGDIKYQVRNVIFDLFRQGEIKVLFLSRIGDEAIDLPNANVAIEVNIQHGSRKQMLQRLGRIMRQKQASSSTHYNAVFYTITTKDTRQWRYFFKRYKCLIDQGFQYDLRLFNYSDQKGIDDVYLTKKDFIEKKFNQSFGSQDAYFMHFMEKRAH